MIKHSHIPTCQYCNQPLTFSHEYDGTSAQSVWDCNICPILVSYCFDPAVLHDVRTLFATPFLTTFYIYRNDTVFIWVNDFSNNQSAISEISGYHTFSSEKPFVLRFNKLMPLDPNT